MSLSIKLPWNLREIISMLPFYIPANTIILFCIHLQTITDLIDNKNMDLLIPLHQ